MVACDSNPREQIQHFDLKRRSGEAQQTYHIDVIRCVSNVSVFVKWQRWTQATCYSVCDSAGAVCTVLRCFCSIEPSTNVFVHMLHDTGVQYLVNGMLEPCYNRTLHIYMDMRSRGTASAGVGCIPVVCVTALCSCSCASPMNVIEHKVHDFNVLCLHKRTTRLFSYSSAWRKLRLA